MVSVILWILAGGVLVAIDRITKFLAVKYLMGSGSVVIIPKILGFYYTTNDGAAFSSFSGKRIALIVLPIVMMIVLIAVLAKSKNKNFLLKLTTLLIIAGGLGNLIDRIKYGYVVDFLNFLFVNFPIFNAADIFVCVGGFILVIYLIFFPDKEKK